jgi:hypothetical protein
MFIAWIKHHVLGLKIRRMVRTLFVAKYIERCFKGHNLHGLGLKLVDCTVCCNDYCRRQYLKIYLKGQSHKKVSELMVWGVSLGPFVFHLIKLVLILKDVGPLRIPICLCRSESVSLKFFSTLCLKWNLSVANRVGIFRVFFNTMSETKPKCCQP